MDSFTPILGLIAVAFLFYPRLMIILDKNIKNVTGPEAVEIVKKNPNIVILDVRTAPEYKSGHIKGAINLPLTDFSRRVDEFEKYRGKPLLVHCASGHRSNKAVRMLSKMMLGPIYHMNRGISSWTGGLK